MAAHALFWPVVVYLGAALLVPRLRPWLGGAARTLLLLLSSVVAFGVALAVAQRAGAAGWEWTLSNWGEGVGAGRGLQAQADALGLAFLLLTGLAGMGVLVGGLDERDDGASDDYQAGLLVLLGSLAALAVADNALTLLVAGLLLDGGLIFGVGLAGRPRWYLVAVMHSLAVQGLLLAATLLLWRDTGTTALSGASPQVLLLLVFAAIARMAPLPFSLFPVAWEPLPRRVLALLPLATLGVGSLLLGRIAQAGQPLPDLGAWGPLAALGVALAGWTAWRRDEPPVRLMMMGAMQAAWALWAFAWGLPAIAVAVGWGGSLALAALAVYGPGLRSPRWTSVPSLVAAAMLLAFPGSALWSAALPLSGAAWRRGEGGLLAVAAVGVMGAVAALFAWLRAEPTGARAERGDDGAAGAASLTTPAPVERGLGAALLALLTVPLLGTLFGVRVPALEGATLPATPPPAQLAALVLGWAGGLWLWRSRTLLQSLRPLLDGLTVVFSFVWWWRLVGRVGWLLLSGLRGMMLVLEGENYGWLLLFLFVTMIVLLQR